MKEGIKLFKVLGIEISLDFSWFIIFFLVTWSLASGYFPFKYPFFAPGTYWLMGTISSVLLFATVLMHELSHSVVANMNGLNIRRIKLFVFGGVAQLNREPQSPRIEFDVAIAGPICSFILHFVFKGMASSISAIWPGQGQNAVVVILTYLSFINLFLAIVNLIPAYPLDGGRVLRAFLWARTRSLRRATAIASNIGKLFALVLILNGFVVAIRGELAGLWYVFIGMFLFGAAKMGYENVLLRDAMSGSRVGEVMSPAITINDVGMTLDRAIDRYFFHYHHSSFPVMQKGKLAGMLNLARIKQVPREDWHKITVGQCLEPMDPLTVVRAGDKTINILRRLAEHANEHFMVMQGEQIVGIITRVDIMKLLKLKVDLDVK